MSLTSTSPDSPILKVGAVVLRAGADNACLGVRSASELRAAGVSEATRSKAQRGEANGTRSPSNCNILIIQPKPKRAGEIPPFVLPRGSRQYQDETGAWVDARDVATGEKHRDTLEPFARAVAREVEEEAGVTPAMLARAEMRELGRLEFQSRSKGVYPIYWFVVTLDETDAAKLAEVVPEDALSVRWATLDEIKVMAARGEFSGGYVEVIEAALRLPD